MELEAFTTMFTQLGDLRVACGPMDINRPSRIQAMTHNHSCLQHGQLCGARSMSLSFALCTPEWLHTRTYWLQDW